MNTEIKDIAPLNPASIAAVDEGGNVYVLSHKDGTVSKTHANHVPAIKSVALSPQSGVLAMGCDGGVVKLRSLSDWATVQDLEKNTNLSAAISLSLQPQKGLTLTDLLSASVKRVVFSSNGRFFAAYTEDLEKKVLLQVWSIEGDQWTRVHKIQLKTEIDRLPGMMPKLDGHKDKKTCVIDKHFHLSPDGKYLVATRRRNLRLLNITKNNHKDFLMESSQYPTCTAFSSDGLQAACGTSRGTTLLYSLKPKQYLKTISGHSEAICAIAFNPDTAEICATAGRDKQICLHNLTQAQHVNIILSTNVHKLIWASHAKGVSILIAARQTSIDYFEVLDDPTKPSKFDIRLVWTSSEIAKRQLLPSSKESSAGTVRKKKPRKKKEEHSPGPADAHSDESSSETFHSAAEKKSTAPDQPDKRQIKSSKSKSTPAPMAVAPAQVASAAPSLLPIPKQPFPCQSFEHLLKFFREFDLSQLLEKAAKGEKTFVFSMLSSYLNPASTVTDMIAANITLSNIFIFSRVALKTVGLPTIVKMISDVYRGGEISSKTYGGKTEGILEAIDALRAYLNQFYRLIQGTTLLDTEALVLTLLKDRGLHRVLNQPEVVKQLAKYCAAAQIPNFSQKDAEKAIALFCKVQELVLKLSDLDKVATYYDLTVRLISFQSAQTIEILQEILPLFKQLEKVIQTFTLPLALPIQLLALPHIAGIFNGPLTKKTYLNSAFKQDKKEWVHAKGMFEAFRSTEAGRLLLTPVAALLTAKNLSLLTFSGKGKISLRDSEEKLPVGKNRELFSGYAFEGFIFKGGHFADIDFKDLYFEECDFSEVAFVGQFSFSEVYMDAKSAQTFLPALMAALRSGKCTIAGDKGIILVSLPDKKKNIPQNIPKKLQQYVYVSYATRASPDFPKAPTESIDASSDPSQSSETEFESCREGEAMEGFKNFATSIDDESFEELDVKYFKKTPGEVAQSVVKDHVDGIAAWKATESDLNQRVQEMVAKGLAAQQNEIKQLRADLTHVQQQLAINDAIHLEQQALLNHRRKEVTVFYQTFLTGLASSLLALSLLGSKIKLFKTAEGAATKISNHQRKKGLGKSLEDNPHLLDRVTAVLLAVKDYGLEVAGHLKVFTKFIPKVGGAVSGAIDFATELNEDKKFRTSAQALQGLTPSDLETIADTIARKIARAYEEQILLLTEKGAARFAECGVFRVIASLLNGYVQSGPSFVTSAWLAMRQIKVDQNGKKLLGLIEVPFTHKPLQVRDSKLGHLTEDMLYRKSGIVCRGKFYSNDRKEAKNAKPLPCTTTCASRVGYMAVSKVERTKYFRDSVTLDDQRRGPQLDDSDDSDSASPAPAVSSPPSGKEQRAPQIAPKKGEIYDQETFQKLITQRIKLIEETDEKIRSHVDIEVLIDDQRKEFIDQVQQLKQQHKFTVLLKDQQITFASASASRDEFRTLRNALTSCFKDAVKNYDGTEGLIITFRFTHDAKTIKTFLEGLGIVRNAAHS